MTTNDIPDDFSYRVDEPAAPARTSADRFFDAIRSWGVVRGSDRVIAGVGSGIAERLGIRTSVVRLVLVALVLLGGLGVALYGLAWAVLPDSYGRIEAQAAHRGDVSVAFVLAVGLVVFDLSVGSGVLGQVWR